MLEISCGIILFTIKNNEVYYLLIKDNNGVYGFPKGHVEKNETNVETALRETLEETSIKPKLINNFCCEINYVLPNGNDKKVIYFLGDFGKQTPKHNEFFEKFEFEILPYINAYNIISFNNVKELLEQANDYIKLVYNVE